MKISILFVVLLAVALLVEEGQCWGRRRRRRSGSKFYLMFLSLLISFFIAIRRSFRTPTFNKLFIIIIYISLY